ncbi:DUF5694 domain-containing protein [Sphingomonadaceae bacterium]|nr:DUF5694 domain-containing protein [Sphingomonadaceae bacterium]
MARLFALIFIACSGMTSASAQTYLPEFQPDELHDRPIGSQNEVVVLGTPHLSQLPDGFLPSMVEPIVQRFSDWSPAFIAVESMSGLRCAAMKQMPSRFDESSVANYCYDTASAEVASGLSVFEANALVEERLNNMDNAPSAADRRRTALLFLAAGEPGSALIQWLYLPEDKRLAADGLTVDLVNELERRRNQQNEVSLIAAPVAVRSSLQRLWSVDGQDVYSGPDVGDGYGAALTAAWANPASEQRKRQTDTLLSALGEPGALLALYRAYNAPEYATVAYESDWGAALTEPSAEQYGRRYVSYWETRNLRMVANIREVLGRSPGSRMLAIVGASHKGYYEAYLAQMRDIELVDVLPILDE